MAGRTRVVAAGLAALVASAPAAAQQLVDLSAEVATDERRRGLSWTDGRATAAAAVFAQLPIGVDATARVTALRDSDRHADAAAVVDLEGGYAFDLGAVRLDARVIGHLFADARERMDYVELGGGAGFLYGPLQLDLLGRYAPSQDAIGGDNLYLGARASAGIPATPFTVRAAVGRSSGGVDEPVRAARLRPDGRYHDWLLGLSRISGRLSLAVEYTGTDVDDDGASVSPFAVRRHAGDRVTVRAGVRF